MPKYTGGSTSTYLFELVCFWIGITVLTALLRPSDGYARP